MGDCIDPQTECIVYRQNFEAADRKQIDEYWKREGLPSFKERGWKVIDTLGVFNTAYNKQGRFKTSTLSTCTLPKNTR
jgi:hypothetical protein